MILYDDTAHEMYNIEKYHFIEYTQRTASIHFYDVSRNVAPNIVMSDVKQDEWDFYISEIRQDRKFIFCPARSLRIKEERRSITHDTVC